MIRGDHNRATSWNRIEIAVCHLRSDIESTQNAVLERLGRTDWRMPNVAVDSAQRRNAERCLGEPTQRGRDLVDVEWIGSHVATRRFDAERGYAVAGEPANSLRSSVDSACRARW